jgi:gluconolactonase
MLIASSSRIRLLSCVVPLACSVTLLACASGSSGGGTGGQGATGTGGSTGSGGTHTGGVTGTGGSNTGTGGTTGTGGSNTGTGGSNTGTGGSNTGTGGSPSTGGATGSGGKGTGGSSSAGGVTGSGGSGTGGSATGGSGGKGGQAGGTGGSSGSVCPSGTSSPSASAIPAGSTAMKIAGAPPSDSFNNNGNNFTNVEGPVWIGNALYFSEMTSGPNPPPSRILKIDSSDAVTQFYPSGGGGDSGSNGMAVDANGNLVTANHGVGGIVSFSVPGGTKTTIISSFGGKRFNSPNDLTIRSDGTIYFTDPNFQAPQDSMGKYPQPNTGVYMVPPGASPTATELISNLSNPNGVALSLDQKTLYVGHGGGVYSYAVNTDGTIGTTATHVDASNLDNNATDGMAIDCAGDLYVVRVNTHDIDVVSFGGNPGSVGTHLATIGSIPGGGQLTNVAFGGTDHKTLYITVQGSSQHGVYKLAMPIAGMPY